MAILGAPNDSLLVSFSYSLSLYSHVWVNSKFGTWASNVPQITSNTKSRYLICPRNAGSQISIIFALRRACLELQATFEKTAPNDIKMALNTTRSKVPHIHVQCTYVCSTNTPRVPNSVSLALQTTTFEVQATKRPKFWSVSHCTISDIQGRQKSEMHRKTQTELEHLTVKSTLYTLNTYPWGPNFRPFRSSTSGFQDTR